MKKIITKLSALPLAWLMLTSRVFAQEPPRLDNLTEMFRNVMRLVFPYGAVVAVGMVIYGGYMWMMSGGDPGKAKQAQGVLTWAIIGLIFLGIMGLLLDMFVDFLR